MTTPVPVSDNPVIGTILPVITISVTLDLIVVGLRLWARRLKQTKLDLSDWTIIFTELISLSEYFLWVQGWTIGEGYHQRDLYRIAPHNLVIISLGTYVDYYLWAAASALFKVSILLLYRKIFFVHTRFLWAVHILLVLCGIYFVGYYLGLLLMCKPVAKAWDWRIRGGHCGLSPDEAFIISGIANMVLDVILVALPAPIVWKLQLPIWKKICVSGMFALGIGICVLVGIRFKLISESDPNDFNYSGEIPGMFSQLEIHLGIISACLPMISPSLQQIYKSASHSSLRRLLTHVSETTGGWASGIHLRTFNATQIREDSDDSNNDESRFRYRDRRPSDDPDHHLRLVPPESSNESHVTFSESPTLRTNADNSKSIQVTRGWNVRPDNLR